MNSFPNLEPVHCSNCCFLTCIQASQEAVKVVWHCHLFKNFPQFVVIHSQRLCIVNKTEDVLLELSKITSDFECSHEIKSSLLLERKVMTNLDSIFKSRDITLPTKVCLVKAIVFPVVMYGCESWTVKKTERQRIDEDS